MHEVHLVREIVDKVELDAKAKGANRVKTVKIRFNRLTSHSSEHVRFSFDIVKKESARLRDAQLSLTEVAAVAGEWVEADPERFDAAGAFSGGLLFDGFHDGANEMYFVHKGDGSMDKL